MNTVLQHELNDALASVLDDMQRATDQLLAVLESERAALVSGDPKALDEAGTNKQTIMQQLEQLDVERLQLSREQPSRQAALQPEWTRVMESLARCHALNQRNGSTVNQRLIQVRQALSILTGHVGESAIYGRSGEMRASLRSQVLAAA
ncbi:flagellar protein FlgN [Rhodanobacter sp. AS-Z3]|uniref:flagella synthesis protein FlgN n=1 Tax=Rhodanobacter sp. AS-Z3 TaxID=3031330 RepID=UPI00247AAD23|nr:flagellar protein FlgN [Rhodanobacter sp. AS-Z3]WEN14634.1 flagellar protein FlgN [Rhodanobacter sp. AS-Z3]